MRNTPFGDFDKHILHFAEFQHLLCKGIMKLSSCFTGLDPTQQTTLLIILI